VYWINLIGLILDLSGAVALATDVMFPQPSPVQADENLGDLLVQAIDGLESGDKAAIAEAQRRATALALQTTSMAAYGEVRMPLLRVRGYVGVILMCVGYIMQIIAAASVP
jgi:hypothetical protein